MHKNNLSYMSILLVLAACSPDNEGAAPDGNAGVNKQDSQIAINNSTDAENANTMPAQEGQTAGSQLDMNSIPAPVRGRWGMVKNDCTSIHGDAKGLLEISAAKLNYYESRGALAKISEIESTRIRATFNFEGEGQSWQRDMLLEVQDSGKSLVTKAMGDGGTQESYHYTRCAN